MTDSIDLRSDTVTHPTPAMRNAMANAPVGDDQYGEDPSVTELESLAAAMVGKDAAVYVPSGIMGNLSAVLAHCQRGDECLLGDQSHIQWYESGGISTLGGVPMRAVSTRPDGTLPLDEIEAKIRENRPGYPRTGLICIENTHNRMGGAVLPIEYLRELRALADGHRLPVHMDGARIFNAAVASGLSASDIAATVDTVQFCLSKALAAPVGSLVAGNGQIIDQVRKQRRLLGGAMRQSGVIAAAGIVALTTMVDRLAEDHRRARDLVEGLAPLPGMTIDFTGARSNIVVLELASPQAKNDLIAAMKERNILITDFGGSRARLVTHYEITDDDIAQVIGAMTDVCGHAIAKEGRRVPVQA